jgi:hypothetical protein
MQRHARRRSARGNKGFLGGAIFGAASVPGTLPRTDGTLAGNVLVPNGIGGAIYAAGDGVTVTVQRSTFSGNAAGTGGGIAVYSGASLALATSTVNGNTATTGAGIAGSSASALTITNSTIDANKASGTGGGGIDVASAQNAAAIALNNVTVTDNEPQVSSSTPAPRDHELSLREQRQVV